MLILPKVPHHLRTLTSSVSRLIHPASTTSSASAAGSAAGPSVTFTSSGNAFATGNPIIGGGGPFTSNSFLVGGGALTKPGESAGGQLAFRSWAPYPGGGGGGAGAGRSKAGAGHYGYTGHARAFISSAPTASDISNTLLEEDDQDVQAALALHRSRLRSPSVTVDARPAHVRLEKDSLKVIRPTGTLRLQDGQDAERVRMHALMRERSRQQAPPSSAAPPPPPPPAEPLEDAAASAAAEEVRPLGLGLESPPGLSLSSQSEEPVAVDLFEVSEPEPVLAERLPKDYVDPAEETHLDSLRDAHHSGSIPDLIETTRSFVDQPGVLPLPGHARLPTQTTASFNATLKTLAINRPPGAPVDEITAAWQAMLRKGVAPNVESYAVMIRVLCERQLEVAVTAEFAALDKAFVRKTSDHGEGERTNLLPPPPTYGFTGQQPIDRVQKEDAFVRAFALFKSVTTFPTLSSGWLPVETYDALLAACASSTRPAASALAVFSHLKQAVETEQSGLAFTYDSFAGLIASYDRAGRMQDAETVFDGFRSAESAGLVELSDDAVDPDEIRIAPWDAMIAGHFRNDDSASAVAIVEGLLNPTPAESTVSPPTVQPSTFTAVIKGFLASDDLPSALEWFDRVAIADSALPPMEPMAYILLLAHASKTKDLATYDHVFDRFTAHPPAGYHLRPLEVAEAIKLHLAAAQAADASPEEANSHLDRIFEFVARCDRHEQSRYLYPAVIADPILRLLVEHARIDELQDVYLRTLRSGQENVADPLAAVQFHAFFFESVVFWLTTPHAKPLSFNVTERLQLVGLLSSLGRAAGIATDLTGEQICDRVLHLYEQAQLENRGALAMNEPVGSLVADAQALDQHRYELSNPPPPQQPAAADDATALFPDAPSMEAESVAVTATDSASQAGADAATVLSTTTASSVTTETAPSSVDDDLLAPPMLLDEHAAPAEAEAAAPEKTFRYLIDNNLGQLVDAYSSPTKRAPAVECYRALKRGMAKGTIAPVKSLGNLVGALGRAREPELAAEVLELAHLVLLNVPPHNGDVVKAWVAIENQAIIGFAHCGIIERANFHRMNIINAKAAPSSDAYSALVNAAKDTTDDASVARLLFQEAVSLGVEPNLFLYNTVISSLSKARKSEEAIGLFREMEKKGLQPSTVTYGTLVNAFCRTGDPENATKFFNLMCSQPKFKARVPPFNTMMQYFTLTQPDRTRVLHYYDRLVEAKVQPSSHTYNILMQAFGTIEPFDLRAMHKVFDTLRKQPHADARVEGLHWATLINCHGAANKDLDTALQVFNTIADHNAPGTQYGQQGLPDAVCWEAIFNVILIHRRFDLLAEYIDRLTASGLQSTTYIQNVLIRALATEGSIEKARELFESMSDPPMGIAAPHAEHSRKGGRKLAPPPGIVHREPSTYEAMVRAELAAGEHGRALRLCERMEERLYPVSVTAKVRSIMGEDV